jgi:hypothetical protein
MSWIKDNKFMVSLGGGTLVGALLLLVVGLRGSKHYDQAKETFEAAAAEASGFEKLALYPKTENRDGKRKALDQYRKSVESLQSAFAAYRPQEIKNVSPQEFTDRLLAANTEVRKAFGDVGATVPETFFLGFEKYKTILAPEQTTGILDYQLGAIKNLMLALAKAKPSELKNFSRPSLTEEEGQAFAPAATAVARPFPVEISFRGTEKAVGQFLSSIAKSDDSYLVVRTLRITNEKKDPPRASDAKFEAAPDAAQASGADAAASEGLELLGDTSSATDGAAPEAKVADSSRILSQVLGDEQIQVFLRLDVLQFLPAKKLP